MILLCVDWDAVSSISTAIGVIVALFLPFLLDWKKAKNVSKILEFELKENYNLLKRAANMKDSTYNNEVIDKFHLQIPIYRNINLNSWITFKSEFGIQNGDKYLTYHELNERLLNIKTFADEIYRNEGKSIYVGFFPEIAENYILDYEKLNIRSAK